MSDLNLENIVGFKAVDKDGNEQNVTVDEMVDMVSTRMVMALSETSTFAAAAATGNDVYENELPTVTDAANVRVLQSSGDAAKMTMQSLASKLGELAPFTFFLKPYKSYENVVYNNQSELCPKGVSLVICYNYENPNNNHIVFLLVSRGNTEENPIQTVLSNKGMEGKIGWYGTLELTSKPQFNVTIKSILLG